jgi:hypothetical protein
VTRALLALGVSVAAVTFITFYARSARSIRAACSPLALCCRLFVLVNRVLMRRVVRWRCGVSVINQLVIDDGGPNITLPGAFRIGQSFALTPALDDPNALDRIGMIMRNADRVVISSVPERRACWSIILKGPMSLVKWSMTLCLNFRRKAQELPMATGCCWFQ